MSAMEKRKDFLWEPYVLTKLTCDFVNIIVNRNNIF